ncbi:hypothetical protein EDD11_005773 [Mortierella claussenii]|nr:hypothetical protein EDD11_005773 [Mortierella claussenii]
MSAISPSSFNSSFPRAGSVSSVSSMSGSVPSTPIYSRPLASMAIADLIMAEAQYLTSLKDIIAVNEDLQEAAELIHELLVVLEPILSEHGRDLSVSLKKLTRRDQNSEHPHAEWDSVLRQPFEHLTRYDDWLQRIDPQSSLCKDARTRLNGLMDKVKMATDSSNSLQQQPSSRNMFRRLSTMARGVIKGRGNSGLSLHTAGLVSSPTELTPTSTLAPHSPLYANDPNDIQCLSSPSSLSPSFNNHHQHHHQVMDMTQSPYLSSNQCPASPTAVPDILRSLTMADAKSLPALPTELDANMVKEPVTPIADTFLAAAAAALAATAAPSHFVPSSPTRSLVHRSSTLSELSSTGTLAMDSMDTIEERTVPSSELSSSASSMCSKTSSYAETLHGYHHVSGRCSSMTNVSSSLARQAGSEAEMESHRKTTLRLGTSEVIQARAERLQSASPAQKMTNSRQLGTRASMDDLKKQPYHVSIAVKTVKDSKKPPVKSLINFWEQVSDPLEA